MRWGHSSAPTTVHQPPGIVKTGILNHSLCTFKVRKIFKCLRMNALFDFHCNLFIYRCLFINMVFQFSSKEIDTFGKYTWNQPQWLKWRERLFINVKHILSPQIISSLWEKTVRGLSSCRGGCQRYVILRTFLFDTGSLPSVTLCDSLFALTL